MKNSVQQDHDIAKLFENFQKVAKVINANIDELKKNTPKGEFVVIIAPNRHIEIEKPYISIIKRLILKNFSNRDIVDLIKPISIDSKKEIYKIVLSIRQNE